MKKLLFFFSVLLIQNITAQTFFVGGLNFNITSTTTPRTVEVSTYSIPYQGDITIPALVSYNSLNYSVTNIGNTAFKECDKLTSIIIPNSVTTLGDNAFYACSNLLTVVIPSTITSLGKNCFGYCYRLLTITILATDPPVTGCPYTFYEVNPACILNVPVGSKTAYQTTNYWNQFEIINEVADIGTATELNIDNRVKIYASNGQIVVEGAPQNEKITVYTITGNKIYNGVSNGGEILIPCGNRMVYLVRTQNKLVKVIM